VVLLVFLGRSPPSPFIGSRRGGYMHGVITEVVIFPQIGRKQWIVAVAGYCGA